MKQFTLKLSKDAQRPIVILSNPFRLDTMPDTGITSQKEWKYETH